MTCLPRVNPVLSPCHNASVETLRKLTTGPANFESQFIGRATIIAIPSGLLRPNLFGTSYEREVGEDGNHDAEGDLVRVMGEEGHLGNRPGQFGGKRCSTKRTREDADERDADLHRREKAVGRLGQFQGNTRITVALVGKAARRAFLEETTAISAIANTPFATRSRKMMATSMATLLMRRF